ncbi:cobalamin B12-binding domain-containing protein [Clostridium thailandense]|uniref:cobalamin B12-binding domain-containing protein n=1 Tax=Clostridium thailandense TaxID=2794346 RepID=UPI0028B165A3|nr:cobalamin-dependent protein [Clostridium thailandense]
MELNIYQSEFENSLLQYDKSRAFELLDMFLLKNGKGDFIDKIIVEVLIKIGEKWEKGTVALSQVYMSSRICEEMIEKLLPTHLNQTKAVPPMAIVTLEDHHNLGKKIVSAVLKSAGYKIKDYGFGIRAEEIIEKALSDNIKILLISVLMYPSALKIKGIVDILHEKDPSIKILVGGAPFLIDKELWKSIGADAMGKSAADDIPIIERWIRGGVL